jgi:hypothetical protein
MTTHPGTFDESQRRADGESRIPSHDGWLKSNIPSCSRHTTGPAVTDDRRSLSIGSREAGLATLPWRSIEVGSVAVTLLTTARPVPPPNPGSRASGTPIPLCDGPFHNSHYNTLD